MQLINLRAGESGNFREKAPTYLYATAGNQYAISFC